MADTPKIPKIHRAAVYDKPGSVSTKIVTVDTPEPGNGEVLIHLTHSGVCHSDFSIMTNGWEKTFGIATMEGQIGGHEGVGHVVKLGPGAENTNLKIGDRVGVKWLKSTCQNCPDCFAGNDPACAKSTISGFYQPGTFQEYVLGPATYVTPIPDGLDSAMAAPMLCAGITTYSALRKVDGKTGDFVVISGSGGGLGHLAVQIGRTMGYRIIGIDDDSKKELTLQSGAEAFVGLSNGDKVPEEVRKLTGGLGAHAVIVCTNSLAAYETGILLLRYKGRLIIVGLPHGDGRPISTAHPVYMIRNELCMMASVVGNRMEAHDCLQLAARGLVKAHFRVEKLDKLNEVFQDMSDGKLEGRVVLDLS